MGQLKVPPRPETRTTKYGSLKGADFSVDPSLVAHYRSPMPINMISDMGGHPKKRVGWRILHKLNKKVYGMWRCEIEGIEKWLIHAGDRLYEFTESSTKLLKTGLNEGKGTGFSMNLNGKTRFFILTGREYLVYDGQTTRDVKDIAKVPITLISRNPTGGGTLYEETNLLSDKRKVSFLGNDKDTTYYLPDIDIKAVDEVKVQDDSGKYVITTNYTADLKKGSIKFQTVQKPKVTGQDNVQVMYTVKESGDYEKIAKCTIHSIYGYNALNRVFLAGNPEYKAYDWHSGINDPTYIPDVSYAIVGTSDTAIMGYCKLGEFQAIIKSDNNQDTTIFLRFGEVDEKKTVFRVRQGIVGVGAISKHCFYNLGDEPLFLTRTGIYAITSTLLNYERTVKNRSYYLDKKLTAEEGLENAIACEWNGYYILAVNGRCYILDGRNKSGSSQGNTDFAYEGYYFENVPATCFLPIKDSLYFGTDSGEICKFNTDIKKIDRYSDGGTLNSDGSISGGKAIYAQWTTPNDDDGGVHLYKTLQKKGCLAVLSPYQRSGGKVYFITDGDPERFIKNEAMDIFDWEDIDFSRFTFSSNASPQEIYFNKKQKKYKRLQIAIVNDGINEGFGIHEIIKSYIVSGYSRKRR